MNDGLIPFPNLLHLTINCSNLVSVKYPLLSTPSLLTLKIINTGSYNLWHTQTFVDSMKQYNPHFENHCVVSTHNIPY